MRSRLCPECGRHNLFEIAVCNCGRQVGAVKVRRFSILWATVPLIVPMALVLRLPAPSGLTANAYEVRSRPGFCVETLGVKMSDRQVLTGTARNVCEGPVKKIRLSISVLDDKGNRRVQLIEIKELASGGTQRFERAVSGRVKSWEISSDK